MVASEQDLAVIRAHPDLFGEDSWELYPVKWGFDLGPGWRPVVLRLLERLREVGPVDGKRFRIREVRERLGELQVEAEGAGPAAREAIRLAEEEAGRTCEACGAPGRLRSGRAEVGVLCDRHAHAAPSRRVRHAARLVEYPRFKYPGEAAAALDDWELTVDEGYVVASGEERGTGLRIREEIVLAVAVRPPPHAYAVRGWVELGRPAAHVDADEVLPRLRAAADAARGRILGRLP